MKRAGTTGSARGMALYEEEVSGVESPAKSGLSLPFLPGPVPFSPVPARLWGHQERGPSPQ